MENEVEPEEGDWTEDEAEEVVPMEDYPWGLVFLVYHRSRWYLWVLRFLVYHRSRWYPGRLVSSFITAPASISVYIYIYIYIYMKVAWFIVRR
jgi:hypothetical protein